MSKCQMPDHSIFCKHQVAWLVALAPLDHRAEAERLCVLMLGTQAWLLRRRQNGGHQQPDPSSPCLCAYHSINHFIWHSTCGCPSLFVLPSAGPPAVSADAPSAIPHAAPPASHLLQNHKRGTDPAEELADPADPLGELAGTGSCRWCEAAQPYAIVRLQPKSALTRFW
jgi:hypothetical protein